jgi:hypothetical protein
MVDNRNRLIIRFGLLELLKKSDRFSCSGRENNRSSGQRPNFDAKQKNFEIMVPIGWNRPVTLEF